MATTSFRHAVTDGHNTVIVDFTLHPIRSSNFEVLVQDAHGEFHTHMPDASTARTYLGHIHAMPGALAAGIVRANGTVLCRISFESGVEWSDTGSGNATVLGDSSWQPKHTNAGPTVGPGGAGSHVFAAEVGVDATYAHYVAAGSSVATTLEMVEFSVMAANIPFLRDAAILHRLGKVVVRASNETDPYADSEMQLAVLEKVREQWRSVLPVGKTHHLVVAPSPDLQVSGITWQGGIGTELGVSANRAHANGDFSETWRATAGISWGATSILQEDDNIAEGPTILSGNLLSRFSSADLALIIAERASKSSLFNNLGPYPFPLPPRANIDHTILNRGLQLTLNINVLANDSHSNGHMLSLSHLPVFSALGGRLMISGATSDLIVYTLPAQTPSTAGVDYFSYRMASAATSRTATGYVTVRVVIDDDLVAHWPLDEGEGSIAYDSSSSQNNATISTGGATWVTGHIGGAISLDGTTGQVVAGGLNITTNSITITGWVRCNGGQAGIAGLAMCRDRLIGTVTDSTSAGLHLLGPSNELRYHWGTSGNPSYNFRSGLTLHDAIWTFVALVISPMQAAIYMKEAGDKLESAYTPVGSYTFAPQSFQGPFILGNDAMVSNRHFKGDMDDFRIFRRALTREEITVLAVSSSDAGWVISPHGRPGHLMQLQRAPGNDYSFDFNYTSTSPTDGDQMPEPIDHVYEIVGIPSTHVVE